MQTIPWGHTPHEKPAIYPDPCRETSEGAVHGSRRIRQDEHKLVRTPKVIKKKKKKKDLLLAVQALQ